MSVPPPIDAAMLLAAGFGTRMRPLTDDRPKPLIEVCGKPLIDWAAERLRAGGVSRLVVNAHYLADRIAEHFADADDVRLSPEPEILETGGGVKQALPLLTEGRGAAPFFVVNADALWLDGQNPAVDRLKAAWNDAAMDALLLLHPTVAADDYHGAGDYHLDPDGRARRREEGEIAPFLFAGVQILSPRLFADAPDGAFSLNRLYDRAQEDGRLAALVHDGEWYHVGTPDALAATEEVIARGHTKTNTR
ncbi:MAG: nucleotidyltransferase family protein [Marivibrio sp.]|uniref:nucleotidyltransferase family protein n=1 Tax=Marivibrio sp. TaxID=2039719 RepID=UPI0032EBDDD0